jgi:predicted DNA-binding antitoxin AbrB/MazE fold protein
MINVPAIYENGVLRLTEPVDLREGQQVRVSVDPVLEPLPPLAKPTPEVEEYARRLRAAKTLEEMYAVMETAPESPDIDIVAMINESRRQTGFRMPDPDPPGKEPR